jgi:hypothetical protein
LELLLLKTSIFTFLIKYSSSGTCFVIEHELKTKINKKKKIKFLRNLCLLILTIFNLDFTLQK